MCVCVCTGLHRQDEFFILKDNCFAQVTFAVTCILAKLAEYESAIICNLSRAPAITRLFFVKDTVRSLTATKNRCW